jgi:hypothetical protein
VRYFTIGFLAVRYGEGAARYLGRHRLTFAAGVLAFAFVSYLVSKLLMRHTPSAESS